MDQQAPIFVVDDDKDSRDVLAALLTRAGWTVRTFAGARECAAALESSRPACVITDLQMPGMDGIGLLHQARSLHAEVPVIVMTGSERPEHRAAALAGGATAFLIKPYSPAVLLDALERLALRAYA